MEEQARPSEAARTAELVRIRAEIARVARQRRLYPADPEVAKRLDGLRAERVAEIRRDAETRRDPHRYCVEWSAEDGEYVATCADFPSLSYVAPAAGEAVDGLVHLVADFEEGRL